MLFFYLVSLACLQEKLNSVHLSFSEESMENKRLVNLTNIIDSENRYEQSHSLILKIVDELVRMEINLSRMDPNIKGCRNLISSIKRIKENLLANGYEVVDMLGLPYNEGMKVIANFIPDENLKEGEQIITGIIKPQVDYKGIMIQPAQIVVSQN